MQLILTIFPLNNKVVCYAKTIYFPIAYGVFFIMTFAGFDNDEFLGHYVDKTIIRIIVAEVL